MNLELFTRDSRVFVDQDLFGDWVGVEVVKQQRGEGTVKVRIVYTNEIPGLEIGDTHELSGDVQAHASLTVDDVINSARESAGIEVVTL